MVSSVVARRALPLRRFYSTYRSPFAPRYATQPHINGITLPDLTTAGKIASGFGVAAGIFAVFFFGEVPRVREDILMKIPVIGGYWERSIPPEDNPF
ncbi:hypothetical protein VTO42DRAFT_5767 [Malbranchea cinnamomea]